MTSRRTTSIAITTLLALAACGGGSDDAGSDAAGSGDDATEEPSGDGSAALVAFSGTIEPLVGDAAPVDYTIMVPEGFALSEFGSASSPKLENPDLDFGEETTTVNLLYLPEPNTAQGLVDAFLTVNSTITVLEQADESGFAWFTYSTPSVSVEGEIAFGSAQSSLTLPDGSGLECRAATQHGIDDTWSEADAAAAAARTLEICRTLQPA